MWVRTQDKLGLIKGDILLIVNHDENKRVWSIVSIGNFRYKLGTYESESRAIEVLDEIQERIERKRVFVDEYGDIRVKRKDNAKVYEMPEK